MQRRPKVAMHFANIFLIFNIPPPLSTIVTTSELSREQSRDFRWLLQQLCFWSWSVVFGWQEMWTVVELGSCGMWGWHWVTTDHNIPHPRVSLLHQHYSILLLHILPIFPAKEHWSNNASLLLLSEAWSTEQKILDTDSWFFNMHYLKFEC